MDFDSVTRRFESSHLSFLDITIFNKMSASISFSDKKCLEKEQTLPIVKLTRSKNGKTGTATFIFLKPNLFQSSSIQDLDGMYLTWRNKQILTYDIHIIFQDGKPFLLKAILIFKNSQEWFHFLNFMTCYSQETGLLFSENTSFTL
jgi:photosystem II 13kDa protein